MLAMAAENGLNQVLPQYGYEIEGFTDSLKSPTTSQCVDECLAEIAAETDILQYIESPYSRLMIVWTGSLAVCVRPTQNFPHERNVKNMGSKPPYRPQTVQPSSRRRQEARQVHSPARLNIPNDE